MIEDDTTPAKRIEASLKTPYSEDGNVWSAFTEALASEFESYEAALEDVRAAKFVDSASDAQLKKIADLFNLNRRTDETLSEFQARIKIALRTQTTSTTLPEIREMIAVLLDIDPTSIEIEEPDDEILILTPRIPAGIVEESDVRVAYLNDLLNDISAAGVEAEATLLIDLVERETTSDAVLVDSGLKTGPDSATTADAVKSVEVGDVPAGNRWGGMNWGFSLWSAPVAGFLDAGTDTATAADDVTVNPNQSTVADTALAADAIESIATQNVAWGGDWGVINWGNSP
jgi:hypothetical protein